MKKFLVLGLIVIMAVSAFTGCTNTNVSEPSGDEQPQVMSKVKGPDIEGVIKEVSNDGQSILVDWEDGLVWVSISEDTNFYEDMPEDIAIGYRDVSRDFQAGNTVGIIVEGGIAESYPMQAQASSVCFNEINENP